MLQAEPILNFCFLSHSYGEHLILRWNLFGMICSCILLNGRSWPYTFLIPITYNIKGLHQSQPDIPGRSDPLNVRSHVWHLPPWVFWWGGGLSTAWPCCLGLGHALLAPGTFSRDTCHGGGNQGCLPKSRELLQKP